MSAGTVIPSTLVKQMQFKGENQGKSKKSGNDYHIITLHDPVTLDNIDFFIREGSTVSTHGIQFKDKVQASFGMDFVYGRPQMVLLELKKI